MANQHTSSDIIDTLGSLVPARIIRHHIRKKDLNNLKPFTESYEAAVLFADISGFSSLAEKLVVDLGCQANAAENLTKYVGKSLEKMVATICNKGGDVIKFAGDAILAIYAADRFDGDLNKATLCCAQVAMDLLDLELIAFEGDTKVELSVHCGMGCGSVMSYHVGGLQNRWEYVITGSAVDQMSEAEPEAEAGEVVISKQAKELIDKYVKGVELGSGNYRLDKLVDVPKFENQKLIFDELAVLKQQQDEATLTVLKKLLRCYVPRPVLLAIDSGQSLWVAELRICCTLFCRLVGLSFKYASDLDLIQTAVRTVQEHIYAYEGTLCRFIVDDKGAGLLFAFGLPPFMHENDPVRAIKSALDIYNAIKALKAPDHHQPKDLKEGDAPKTLSCSIGVTSGRVFCGTAGGNVRCEYTLHGTLVNLAARYMVAAKDGILCGEQTYKESRHSIHFDPPEAIRVKGRSTEVYVYRPTSKKLVSMVIMAKTPQVGREEEVKIIDESFDKLLDVAPFRQVITVEAEAGLGKSRLIQYAHRQARDLNMWTMFGAGVDTESTSPFFVWKSIVSQLLKFHGGGGDTAAAKYLLDHMSAKDKLEMVKDMLPDDDKMKEMYPLLAPILPDIVPAVDNNTTEKMKGELRSANLAKLLVGMISKQVEQLHQLELAQKESLSDDVAGGELQGTSGKRSRAMSLGEDDDDEETEMPVRLVLMVEDLQWVDPNSLSVLIQVMRHVDRLVLIVTARAEDICDNGKVSIQTVRLYKEIKELPNSQIIQLRNLDLEQVRKCMCLWLGVSDVPDKAATAVYEKSGGHPLFSEELCKVMKANEVFIVDGDKCKLSKKAQDGNFSLPDTIAALMTSVLDRVLPSQQLTLKVAAVVGMVFQKHELAALMPRGEGDNKFDPSEVRKALDMDVDALVAQGLLVKEQNAVNHFRFKNAMLKESAYNLLLFQMRKDLHYQLARFYEERNKEYLEPVYFLLGHNYYLAEKYERAVKYLELAGNDALDLHGMEQVLSCFTKLLQINGQDKRITASIPLVRKAGWCRKVGEALLYLGKPDVAEEHFQRSLAMTHLDCTDVTNVTCMSQFLNSVGLNKNMKKKPRLVISLDAFKKLQLSKSKEDVELMLEAARTYELLGILNNDRSSSEALERRLNALYLSEAAGPVSAELARSYAHVAVFYTGNRTTEALLLAKAYARKASRTVDRVADSETQALVHFKCSEYYAMVGDLMKAENGIKKATWVCRFLNFDRMRLDCEELHATVTFFAGKMPLCLSILKQSTERGMPGAHILAQCAIVAVVCGEFEVAQGYFERIARIETGAFEQDTITNSFNDQTFEVWLALSLYLCRHPKQSNPEAALKAVMTAIELAVKTDLSHIPLTSFHTIALLLHALEDCLDGATLYTGPSKNAKPAPVNKGKVGPSDSMARKTTLVHLKTIMQILIKYAKAYSPCLPHAMYCRGIYTKIVTKKHQKSLFKACIDATDVNKTPFVKGLGLVEFGIAGDHDKLVEGIDLLEKCGAVYELDKARAILNDTR